jgi:dihydrolipoamide dehydrogenase
VSTKDPGVPPDAARDEGDRPDGPPTRGGERVKEIIVLGGGPAGYVAALRAAQLGAHACVVESREIGGTCLNRGCIPTKAMVAGVDRLEHARHGGEFGILASDVRLDFDAFMARKDAVATQLRQGVEHMLRARKVEVVPGRGRLLGPGRVSVAPADGGGEDAAPDGGRVLEGDAVIVATGSEPSRLPLFDFADRRIMTSDELLRVGAVPESLLVVGGGVIGCEFASIFAGLGSRVTVVELLEQLLPGEDKRVARTLQQAFKKAGIDVMVRAGVESCEPREDGVHVTAAGRELVADAVLVAVGRRPLSREIGLEEAGVEIDGRGFVVVDDTLRTSLDGVFAAGDVAGPPLLAHWAYHQGQVAADNAVTGGRLVVDRRVVPNAVFSSPEVASVGLTEDRAAAAGRAVEVAHLRFNGVSKAVVEGEAEGFVRVVCEPDGGPVLGASLVGPRVSDLVHEIALAVQARLPLAAIAETIHAHPTLAEAVGEAALSGLGRPMHSL